jgi:hypothetical protein
LSEFEAPKVTSEADRAGAFDQEALDGADTRLTDRRVRSARVLSVAADQR